MNSTPELEVVPLLAPKAPTKRCCVRSKAAVDLTVPYARERLHRSSATWFCHVSRSQGRAHHLREPNQRSAASPTPCTARLHRPLAPLPSSGYVMDDGLLQPARWSERSQRSGRLRCSIAMCVRLFAIIAAFAAAAGVGVVIYKFGFVHVLRDAKWLCVCIGLLAICLVLLLGACLTIPGRRNEAELDRAALLSRCMFWWVFPTLVVANARGALTLNQLPALAAADEPHALYDRFVSSLRGVPHPSAFRLLRTTFIYSQRRVFWQCILTGWAFLLCMFADPNLLHLLLVTLQPPRGNATLQELGAASTASNAAVGVVDGQMLLSESADGGWPSTALLRSLCLALLLAASMLVRTTCMELCYFASYRIANNARSRLVMGVFRSAFNPSSAAAFGGDDSGRLTNLMATDADGIGKADNATWAFSQYTFSVASLPAVIYLMWRLLGSAAFVGAAAFIASNFLAALLSKLQAPIVRRLQERRDERSELMSDVVSGITVLKAFGEYFRIRAVACCSLLTSVCSNLNSRRV